MSLAKVSAGNQVPDELNVIVEIPANGDPVKYEVDKDSGAIMVDRFMAAPMFYPCNYGYMPNSLSEDGDPLDILVPTPYPVSTGKVIACRPVGMLNMRDEAGADAKIIAVPVRKLTSEYDHVDDIDDFPALLKSQICHFFTRYKELEQGKWVEVDGWSNAESARHEIIASIDRYAAGLAHAA